MGNKLRVPVRFMIYRMGCFDIIDWMRLNERDMVIKILMPIESMAAMVVANWLNSNVMFWVNMVHIFDMMDGFVMHWMMWADSV